MKLTDEILFEAEDGIAVITIDRPQQRNAINRGVNEGLRKAFDLFEKDAAVQQGIFKLFATNHSPESSARCLHDLLCCLPRVSVPESLGYQNVFRVLIVQFLDAHAFDVRSVKKSCIHIVHPDGRLIPFDTYNLFYRDDLEEARLRPLREAAAATDLVGSRA